MQNKNTSLRNDKGQCTQAAGSRPAHRNPLIDFGKLWEQGLIATSSCVQGLLPKTELRDDRFAQLSKWESLEKLYELGVIEDVGFSDYFLIVTDMVDYTKSEGIFVGPGRGSAAGSMVTYCLGITGLDPIKHDLLLDRFLNQARVTMPDIDFNDDRRDEVFDYLYRKYEEDRVAKPISFNTYETKNTIRDVGKVFRSPRRGVGVEPGAAQARPKR